MLVPFYQLTGEITIEKVISTTLDGKPAQEKHYVDGEGNTAIIVMTDWKHRYELRQIQQ